MPGGGAPPGEAWYSTFIVFVAAHSVISAQFVAEKRQFRRAARDASPIRGDSLSWL
jgi:hypothetical protein